jgi:hypothetical protein
MAAMLTLLVGGPQDGMVTETSGTVPAILLWQPRPATLLDTPEREAHWNPKARWYECRES